MKYMYLLIFMYVSLYVYVYYTVAVWAAFDVLDKVCILIFKYFYVYFKYIYTYIILVYTYNILVYKYIYTYILYCSCLTLIVLEKVQIHTYILRIIFLIHTLHFCICFTYMQMHLRLHI
jgi:hypothetical protein